MIYLRICGRFFAYLLYLRICCLCVFVRAIPPRDLSPFLCIIGVFAPQSSLHFAASKTMSLISTFLPKPCHRFQQLMQLFRAYQHPNFFWQSSIVYDDKYLFYFLSSVCSAIFFRIAEHKYAEVFLYALPLYPVAQQYGAFLLSCLAFPHASCLPNPQKQTSIFKLDFLGECFYVVQNIEKCHLSSKKIGLRKRKTIAVLNINGPS